MHINDLVTYLENEGVAGVELWDIRLFAMLYADDLILIAESELDLKLQMKTLRNYTNRWDMEINSRKKKVMVFHDPKKRKEVDIFDKINNHDIHITNSYKYLGVIVHNKHSFKDHTDMIIDKANKRLFFTPEEKQGVERTRSWTPTISLRSSNFTSFEFWMRNLGESSMGEN